MFEVANGANLTVKDIFLAGERFKGETKGIEGNVINNINGGKLKLEGTVSIAGNEAPAITINKENPVEATAATQFVGDAITIDALNNPQKDDKVVANHSGVKSFTLAGEVAENFTLKSSDDGNLILDTLPTLYVKSDGTSSIVWAK